MVLDEIKKVIEFPAGSLFLLPSATITHCNTPVQEHEIRMSFTQFCAGGIFRYVDNGFRTGSALRERDPAAYADVIEAKKTRWELGISLWSKLDDLVHIVNN